MYHGCAPQSTVKFWRVRKEFAVAIYAIADTHLSLAVDKPMTVFGPLWAGHPELLFERWRETVGPDDIVLVPGDISWGMRLDEALPDLQALDALPGRKILIQGNHDYWWQSVSKLRALPLETISFIQNDHVLLGDGWAACGTRGWICPGDRAWAENPDHNQKIYDREVQRLGLSLASAAQAGASRIIAMTHYPPFDESGRATAFTDLLSETPGVEICLYGHIHSAPRHEKAVQGEVGGVTYHLVAADYLQFSPKCIVA